MKAQEELRSTLKKAREDSNLTQQELADAIGTGIRTVGGAESGSGNPRFDTLFRIVRYLNIPGGGGTRFFIQKRFRKSPIAA